MDRIERIPPQNLEAEQATLGSMMIERSALDKSLDIVKAEDFYRPVHQEIYDCLATLSLRDEPVDMITLTEELRRRDKLEECGGVEYIIALHETVPTAANLEYYARIVAQKSVLRKLITAGTEIVGLGYNEEEDVETLADRAEQIVFQVSQNTSTDGFRPIMPLLQETWDWIDKRFHDKGKASGVATGFEALDSVTAGLQASDLIIIAARPSVGKTSLAMNIAENASVIGNHTVAVFSLEMSASQLVQRLLCSRAHVNAQRLRTGQLEEEEFSRIAAAAGELSQAPIFIDDTTDTTALAMRAKCRRLKAQYGLSMVIIDYMQLMRGHKRTENRQQEVSEIARSLKNLARELKVPVIALSQLSRAPEQRTDKKPVLSDLRESGSIEAEADIVALMYRAGYYKAPGESTGPAEMLSGHKDYDVTEIIIAKHRNGPTGTIKLGFVRDYANFVNLTDQEEM